VQDCLALQTEIPQVQALGVCDGVAVVPSKEVRNPVAAVLLRDFGLPDVISPARVDLRIPIPDLYGFASSASVVLFDRPLLEINEAEGQREGDATLNRRVPFCEPITSEAWEVHRPYLTDFRCHPSEILHLYYLCLTPLWSAGSGYQHTTLSQFVRYLHQYLQAPTLSLERDAQICEDEWAATGEAWWLLRAAHIYEGLGRFELARETCVKGHRVFPARKEFPRLLGRIERTQEQTQPM
jgi:hypothetical protein